MKSTLRSLLVLAAAFGVLAVPAATFAATTTTPNFTQTVNPGTLWTDILQSDGTTPVASPAVAFSALNKSFSCQTSTATLGDTNNKLYVNNLDANGGWTLAIATTGGNTATWTDSSKTYSFNDASSSGCATGQLTVDASTGTVTPDCSSVCDAVTVNKGSSTAYDGSTVTSATLMTTSSGSGWKGYLTGVSLSQKVPANQESGSYSLGMTITVAAP